jgi:hypothetical protein
MKKSTKKPKKPAVKVLLLIRPRKVPGYWPRSYSGRPEWSTITSSRTGEVDGFCGGIDFDRAIDERFANDLIDSCEELYGKGYIVRVVTVQVLA